MEKNKRPGEWTLAYPTDSDYDGAIQMLRRGDTIDMHGRLGKCQNACMMVREDINARFKSGGTAFGR